MDISEEAIKKCKNRFGSFATFLPGTELNVPEVDIIISSNVFEHLSNHIDIAKKLKNKCKKLFIIVPFEEDLKKHGSREHINSYTKKTFNEVSSNIEIKIFRSKGWGETTKDLYLKVYLKNIGRFLLGKKLRKKIKQIMFIIE